MRLLAALTIANALSLHTTQIITRLGLSSNTDWHLNKRIIKKSNFEEIKKGLLASCFPLKFWEDVPLSVPCLAELQGGPGRTPPPLHALVGLCPYGISYVWYNSMSIQDSTSKRRVITWVRLYGSDTWEEQPGRHEPPPYRSKPPLYRIEPLFREKIQFQFGLFFHSLI